MLSDSTGRQQSDFDKQREAEGFPTVNVADYMPVVAYMLDKDRERRSWWRRLWRLRWSLLAMLGLATAVFAETIVMDTNGNILARYDYPKDVPIYVVVPVPTGPINSDFARTVVSLFATPAPSTPSPCAAGPTPPPFHYVQPGVIRPGYAR